MDMENREMTEDQKATLTRLAMILEADPIYQIRSTNSGTWHDVDKERYYSTRFERRIVYTHDLNNRILALEASHYLKDAEIAALRERIAALDAGRMKALWRILMCQVIETSGESYLTLRCVGVPPTEDEFASAVNLMIDAEMKEPK